MRLGKLLSRMDSEPAAPNIARSMIRWRWHLWLDRLLGGMDYHRFAAHHFQTAIESRPDHLLAYFLLGWTLGRLGQYEKAISVFDRALEMGPDRAYPHAHKALCCLYLGRYQDAAYGLERPFRIEPRYKTLPLFAESLARCYANLGSAASHEIAPT